MEALGNARYGSWRPLNNLTQTFQACHLCTFNVAAIFFGTIPIYGVLPYAMIYIWKSQLNRLVWGLNIPNFHVLFYNGIYIPENYASIFCQCLLSIFSSFCKQLCHHSPPDSCLWMCSVEKRFVFNSISCRKKEEEGGGGVGTLSTYLSIYLSWKVISLTDVQLYSTPLSKTSSKGAMNNMLPIL